MVLWVDELELALLRESKAGGQLQFEEKEWVATLRV